MDRGDIAQRLGVANMQGDKLLDAVQAIVKEVIADYEKLLAIWIDDRTNNEKHDCVSYARAVIAADRALRGQPVAWIDKHELAMIPLWPDEPTVSAQPVSEYDVPLYASPTIPEGYALVPIEPTYKMREALESIAANTCCNSCQEAALVAQKALAHPADVGLTDDEIIEAANEAYRALPEDADEQDEIIAVSRAVIQAHETKKAGGDI